MSKKDIIFNELAIDFSYPINLVEGVFDAIVAGENSVPLLGSFLSETDRIFKQIVKNKTKVYIALDADAKIKERKIISLLEKYSVEVEKVNISPFNDVGSMAKRDYQKRKKESYPAKGDGFLQFMWQEV